MRSVDRLDTCVRPQRAGTGGPSGGGPWTYLIAARAAAPVARNAPAELPIGMITYGTRPSGGTDATHTFAGALQEAPASRIACASATVTEPNLGFSTMSRYSYVVLPAEADLARLAESLPDRYGDVTAAELAEARLTPHVQPLTESIIGDVRAAILLLLLFEVDPHEPHVYIIVPLLVLGVALLASAGPAGRAAKTEPVPAFRSSGGWV